jgi:hypothetical protein
VKVEKDDGVVTITVTVDDRAIVVTAATLTVEWRRSGYWPRSRHRRGGSSHMGKKTTVDIIVQ